MFKKEYTHAYLGESQGRYSHDDLDTKNDCVQIKRILAERGVIISTEHAYHAWAKMSHDDYCAGWLTVDERFGPDLEKLMKYLTPIATTEN